MSLVTKIRPVAAELFDANRQTGMAKLEVAFRNFANSPKNQLAKSMQEKYHRRLLPELH